MSVGRQSKSAAGDGKPARTEPVAMGSCSVGPERKGAAPTGWSCVLFIYTVYAARYFAHVRSLRTGPQSRSIHRFVRGPATSLARGARCPSWRHQRFHSPTRRPARSPAGNLRDDAVLGQARALQAHVQRALRDCGRATKLSYSLEARQALRNPRRRHLGTRLAHRSPHPHQDLS